jgi:hypothetical protein
LGKARSAAASHFFASAAVIAKAELEQANDNIRIPAKVAIFIVVPQCIVMRPLPGDPILALSNARENEQYQAMRLVCALSING